ncbi:peptidase S24-like protein [Buttiauxella sp. JUb87]|uniref:S24 family peptidase n=1 Tax=Buttiauxella sp. JUb87 TaxID=2485129 RepID=UPI00105B6168|nr:S24 family peptidase [Buttiauxella sp. JUb87]TDN54652.1 peptidase S24-like protein [Buttiauxella sp. JUb87]
MNITPDKKFNKKLQACNAGIIPFNLQPYGIEQQFVINMPDDSMSGTIEAGEQCLVKKHQGNLWDAVYLYELDGQHFIKRFQTVKNKLLIISDNKLYETWEANEEIKKQMNIIGMVTAYLQIHRIG